MRHKNRRWLFVWTITTCLLHMVYCEVIEVNNLANSTKYEISSKTPKEPRGVFSPRMDYEQWTPLGRGDPLKNDPTYDYVPPVLERVHYWVDPSSRKPDPQNPGEQQKTEILVLGVSSKKPSTPQADSRRDNSYEIKDSRSDYDAHGTYESERRDVYEADSRRDVYDPFMKFVDGPKFNNYQRISKPTFTIPFSYFPQFYKSKERPNYAKNEHQVPYTFLLPPPIPPMRSHSDKLSSSTTQSSVTIQESNLIYQSTTNGDGNEWIKDDNYYTVADSSLVTWRTPLPYNEYKPNLNKQPSESYMQIQQHFNTNNVTRKPMIENVSIKHDVASFEMQLSTDDQISGPDMMYKGHVSDGDMDASSKYVNIGKVEAQMHGSSGPSALGIDTADLLALRLTKTKPVTLQTLQTMQPPPLRSTNSIRIKAPTGNSFSLTSLAPTSTLTTLLQKEITSIPPIKLSTPMAPTSATMSSFIANIPKVTTRVYTTTPPPTTTTTSSLTTDPFFKHYKQPSEPLRGPMYLIIQGHSKVKTYGPSKQIHGINIQEMNEIPNTDYGGYPVKHLHTYKKKVNDSLGSSREGRAASNLKTLSQVVKTGIGAIDFANQNRRNDIHETELEVRFDVDPKIEAIEETYRKGIVIEDVTQKS